MSKQLQIVDQYGRPYPRTTMSSDFEGATYGRRLGTWGMSSSGPNTALFGSLNTLKYRSRQLIRNDPNMTGGQDTLAANLVGCGITPRWLMQDPEIKAAIIALWDDWVNECDADEVLDFYGLQTLAALSLVESGELLIHFKTRRWDSGLSVPFQLQLIEADHLDPTYNDIAPNGNEIRMSIEFDKRGKRVAFWPFKEHPGEYFLSSGYSSERIRIPASQMLHIFRPKRPGQKRGAPWLASVILAQHDLNEFDDAEIVRKKGAAMFGGFIYKDASVPAGDFGGLGGIPTNDDQNREIDPLEPGTFPVLPSGYKVSFSEPADVGGNYEAFTQRQDRRIARGFGNMSYEMYTGNLKDVNYTSIRQGNLQFQRWCKMIINNVLVFQMCRPIAREFMNTAVLSRALDIPGYASSPKKYFKVAWDIDGWPWVDPEKDLKAAKGARRSGFKSLTMLNGESGHDSAKIDQEIAEENKRQDALGLVYDSDPRKTDGSGKLQGAPSIAADDYEDDTGEGDKK